MIKINWIMGGLMGALFLFLPMCLVWLHEARTLMGCVFVFWGMIVAIVCIAEMMEACDKPMGKRPLPRNTRRRPNHVE